MIFLSYIFPTYLNNPTEALDGEGMDCHRDLVLFVRLLPKRIIADTHMDTDPIPALGFRRNVHKARNNCQILASKPHHE
jgi:hypothetical protein